MRQVASIETISSDALEMLDDQDDVQNVWSNFDIPAEMMESA